MVSAEKNNGNDSYGRLSRRRSSRDSSPQQLNTAAAPACVSEDSSAADENAEERDNGMRVGGDYQAIIPHLLNSDDHSLENLSEKALLVWSPNPDLPEPKLDEFLTASKEKYGYNAEQALGMLFWHKHDLEKALYDLPNFTPFPDEWTVEDKVLFEQAFQFHGKCFYRIRQMLPDKSISSLIKYYYSWKKTRSRTSLMDRQARKRARQRGEGGEAGSEEGSNSESEFEGEQKDVTKENSGPGSKSTCSNCTATTSQIQSTPKGNLCLICYQYWKRTGAMKPTGATAKRQDIKDRHAIVKSKRRPPRGMYLKHEDLKSIAMGPPGQGEAILKGLDSEVVSLKRLVQNNKQMISSLKHKTSTGIDEYRPPESSTRLNSRWTNDELLIAVQGVRKYGKDCKAIAEVIGNKAEVHVKNFFLNYNKRYNLDAVVKEYEAENGPIIEDEKDEKMEIETSSASNSNSGTSTPVAFTIPASSSSPAPSSSGVNIQSLPPVLTSVPPPLLKPVQSPSIMNRSSNLPQPQPTTRLPIARTSHQPPPLIATSVNSPHSQPTPVTSID